MTDRHAVPSPIERCVDRWHRALAGELDGGVASLLHPEVVFFSPVVFAPQPGRDLTTLYLLAAEQTIAGPDSGFTYTKQILSGYQAALEFETTLGDTVVNGVDIITCDDDARITEFKVMVRPARAMTVVQEQMRAMLDSMAP